MIKFLREHMIFTIIIAFWLLGLFTFATYMTFTATDPTQFNVVYGIVNGVVAVAIGVWKWREGTISNRSKNITGDIEDDQDSR